MKESERKRCKLMQRGKGVHRKGLVSLYWSGSHGSKSSFFLTGGCVSFSGRDPVDIVSYSSFCAAMAEKNSDIFWRTWAAASLCSGMVQSPRPTRDKETQSLRPLLSQIKTLVDIMIQ